MKTEQEELDDIIQDMLDDDYEQKFPDAKSKQVSEKQKSGTKKTDQDIAESTKKQRAPVDNNLEKKTMSQKVVQISRYVILASVVLFFVAIFMNWISLSGNTTNYGFIRDEKTRPYLEKEVREYDADNLVQYERKLVSFSGKDLYTFSTIVPEGYMTVMGIDDQQRPSISAKVHLYYMKAAVLLFIFTLAAAVVLLVLKGTKGILFVRTMAIFNVIVVGLNYMALKIPFFSIFAIHAKDLLKQEGIFKTISMTRTGIAMDDTFYPYVVKEELGLYIALVALGIWLLLSIILTEVDNKEKEKMIEQGE